MLIRKRWCTIVAGVAGFLLTGLMLQGTVAVGSARPDSTRPSRADSPTPTYSAVVLADTPSIYWRLGDSSGVKAMDSSGNGRDGVYLGSPTLGVHGAIAGDPDTAMRLHGNPDTVEWTSSGESYSGPYTVEEWVRSRVHGGDHAFFSSRYIGDFSFDAQLSTGYGRGVRVDVGGGGQWFVTHTIPFKWRAHKTYYIAVVATTTDVTVYVDGAPIGTRNYPCGSGCPLPLLYDATHEIQVGQDEDYPVWFVGRLDEVAVYQHALSPDQVAAHYAAGL